jgi:hypothetical protein
VPEKDPANQISSATWEKVAADMERLALTNEQLKRTIEELQQACLETSNENERLKNILRDHNIPLEGPAP